MMRPHGGIIRRFLDKVTPNSVAPLAHERIRRKITTVDFHAWQSMSETISYADLKSAVLERSPHWRKQADMQQSAAGQPDAHRLGATLASRVFSWPRMRVAVARPNQMSAEKIDAPEQEDGIPLPIK
jgi:hypothetical protein